MGWCHSCRRAAITSSNCSGRIAEKKFSLFRILRRCCLSPMRPLQDQEPKPDQQIQRNARVSTRATGVVGIAVMCSRVLGLIREQLFAGLFGAGRNLDAFLMAFRVPNMLRDLFAEGALSTAFITTFSKKIATEGDESAWSLANKVATLAAVFLSGITLLGV